jgi:hypothetical protein
VLISVPSSPGQSFPARAVFPSSDFASRRSLARVPVGVVEFWFGRLIVDLADVIEPSTPSSVTSGLHAGCRRLSSRRSSSSLTAIAEFPAVSLCTRPRLS